MSDIFDGGGPNWPIVANCERALGPIDSKRIFLNAGDQGASFGAPPSCVGPWDYEVDFYSVYNVDKYRHISTVRLLAICGDICDMWRYMAICGDMWRYVAISVDICRY